MADKDFQMTQRNAGNTAWDNLYPTTKAVNVQLADTGDKFTATNMEGAMLELFTNVSNGKTQVASAITDKGVSASGSDTFPQLATKISTITTGGIEVLEGTLQDPTGAVSLVKGITDCYDTFGTAFSQDGKYLASVDNMGYLTVYSREGDDLTFVCSTSLYTASNSVSFSGSDYIAVTQDIAPHVKIYKFNGSSLTYVTGADMSGDEGVTATFSPSGQYVAVSCQVAELFRLFRFTGTSLVTVGSYTLPGSGYKPCFSPNSELIAIPHYGGAGLTLLRCINNVLSLATTYTVTGIAYRTCFSPDGLQLVVGTSSLVTVLAVNGNTLTLVKDYSLPSVKSIKFFPNGRDIAVCHGHTGQFSILRLIGSTLTSFSTFVLSATTYDQDITPDGQYVVAGGFGTTKIQMLKLAGTIKPFRVREFSTNLVLSPVEEVSFKNSYIEPIDCGTTPTASSSASFSPTEGKYVALGQSSSPYNVGVFDTTGDILTSVCTYTIGNKVSNIAFSPGGKFIALAYTHATAPFMLLKFEGGSLSLVTSVTLAKTGKAVAFSPNGQYIAMSYDNTPYLTLMSFDGVSSVSPVCNMADLGVIESLAFSPEGKYLACGFKVSPYFALYAKVGETLVLEATYTLPGTCYDIAFSPDGQYIAVAHSTASVTVFKRQGATLTPAATFSIGTYYSNRVSFSPDGQYLIVCTAALANNFYILKFTGGDTLTQVFNRTLSSTGKVGVPSGDGKYIIAGGSTASSTRLLKVAGSYPSQAPNVIKYKGKSYMVVEPNDNIR